MLTWVALLVSIVVTAYITWTLAVKAVPAAPPAPPAPAPVKVFGLATAFKAAPLFRELGDQAGLGAKIAMAVLAMMEIPSRLPADLQALFAERNNQIDAARDRIDDSRAEIDRLQGVIDMAVGAIDIAEADKARAAEIAALFGQQ